jgi:hypothetical protein
MRTVAPISLAIIASLAFGCSTMGSKSSNHPGITDNNPDLVVREFPATATQMAKVMVDVMAADPILDNASMKPAGGREYRNFSKAEREALGVSMLERGNDVNWNLEARSKDGHPVAVAIRLKGEAACEISVLYGSRGDVDLSKDLLDKAQASLEQSKSDAAVTKTSASKAVADKAAKP